jgi:hypothetical protein
MENRHGLIITPRLTTATGTAERVLMTRQKYPTVIIEKCPPCGNRKGTPLLGS